MTTPELAGKRVTAMGLGRFGGGVGVARFLCEQGAQVLVTDLDPRDKLVASIEQLRDLIDAGSVTLRLGGHNPCDFTDSDLVVANPAVPRPWDNPYLRASTEAGVPITTEIRLLAERLPSRRRVIGVTGTAGKSTTSAMIAHILSVVRGRAHLGGNIGGSLLPTLADIRADDWVVLELSSAQLHWLAPGAGCRSARGWSPAIAVVTNIAPNHLDWHAEMPHYAASKAQILQQQDHHDTGVIGAGVQEHIAGRAGVRPFRLLDQGCSRGIDLSIPGAHNRLNAAMAVQAAMAAGIPARQAQDALASFAGLPHRLQRVAHTPNLRAYNDSKCTTPEACVLAIGAFEEPGECGASRVHLICGGYDKRVDLAPMIAPASRCAGVYTIGATGAEIARRVNAQGGRARHCEHLDAAVEAALSALDHRPSVLLLSPGCASWDQFTNYEERGERFVSLLRDHAEGGSKTIVT